MGKVTANELQNKLETEIVKIIENINTTSDSKPVTKERSASSRSGFQILGPEGWKTFDQDERLILAMTSSGKPLISSMRELSNRILNEQPDPSKALLPLVNEQLKISRAERILSSAVLSQTKDMSEIIEETLKELKDDLLN